MGGRLNNSRVSAAVRPWDPPARERGGHRPGFFPRSGGGAAGGPGWGPQPRSRELPGGGLHRAGERRKEFPQEPQLPCCTAGRARRAAKRHEGRAERAVRSPPRRAGRLPRREEGVPRRGSAGRRRLNKVVCMYVCIIT